MSIQWDSVLVRGLATELGTRFDRARLRAVHMDHRARSLTLFFRTETLVFRLHAERGDVSLTEAREPGEDARPLAARLRGVQVRYDDRLLRLQFLRVRGRPARIDIVVELMTNQWNALVLEAESGVIRHALWSRDVGDRRLRTGAVYREPRGSTREGPEQMTLERWRATLDASEPSERKKALLRHMAYTSALNAPALLAGSLDVGYRRWTALEAQPLGAVCLLARPGGPQPYPHALPPVESAPAATLFAAFATATKALDESVGDRGGALPSPLMDALQAVLNRARGRVVQLERQLDRTPDPAALRAVGDLLLARIKETRKGATSVELTGFDGAPVRVELDPTLGPAENARAYYSRASRAERAAAQVPELLRKARRDAESLETLHAGATAGDMTAEEVRSRVSLPASGSQKLGVAGPSLPYRKYRSSGGLEIRVGRGSKHNDDLTFHHSLPNDVWLHARHAAGAHVVLRWSRDGNPPARDLEEAAVLAALHSKARTSRSVPVDWTRRKYVRKPRKAPRGSVTLDRVKTVFVDPDPALAEALAADEVVRAPGPRSSE